MTASLMESEKSKSPRSLSRWLAWIGAPVIALTLLVWALISSVDPQLAPAAELDAKRAYDYLEKICDLGPRFSGSEGMTQQQEMIKTHFADLKAEVKEQSFDARHPRTGQPVRMTNIIVSWHPQAKERVLLACHYDTRPFPDRDPNPKARTGQFLGANDGASGVALFMEMGNQLARIRPTYGVDMVFFDGEELVFTENDPYFLGAEEFSRQYRDQPPPYKYVYGVLVDMIGDKNLNIFQEENSLNFAPELTASLWQTARRLQVKEFIPRKKHAVRDDHLALNEIARIPSCDIIDFDYPYWHTAKDVPANCSGASLAKVGKVLLTWLEHVPAPRAR